MVQKDCAHLEHLQHPDLEISVDQNPDFYEIIYFGPETIVRTAVAGFLRKYQKSFLLYENPFFEGYVTSSIKKPFHRQDMLRRCRRKH